MSLEIEIEERMYVSQERSYHLSSGKRIRVSPGVNGIAQVRRFSSGVLLETFVITEEQTYGEYFKDMRFSVKCIAETVLVKLGEDNREVVVGSSTYTASGGVERSIDSKLGDVVSLIDFGAIGDGVTNNFQAITDAMAAAAGRKILVPVDAAGGDYAVTAGSLTLTGVFEYETGARIYANGGTVTDNSRYIGFGGADAGEQGRYRFIRGLNIHLNSGNTGAPLVEQGMYNYIYIKGDDADFTQAGGSKGHGLFVDHRYGGSVARGGRHAVMGRLMVENPTATDNPDRNYVGVVGQVQSILGDGGTLGSPKGTFFGGNFVADVTTGGQYITNITGAEFNVGVAAGSTTSYRTGLAVAMHGAERGSVVDAGIAIYNLGPATTTLVNGVRIGPYSGTKDILGVDSVAFLVSQPGTIAKGIAFNCPISGSILEYNIGSGSSVSLASNVFALNSPNANIELGSLTTVGLATLDFHSSGINQNYDSRIQGSSGSSGNGNGDLTYTAATHSFVGGMRFGTYTADGAAAIAGFITITDAGGTTRKLLVAA